MTEHFILLLSNNLLCVFHLDLLDLPQAPVTLLKRQYDAPWRQVGVD